MIIEKVTDKDRRYIRYKQGAELYNICQSTFERRAKEAGAIIKLGKIALVDCEVFEEYLETF